MIYDMDNRRDVDESLKRDNKKENDEGKKYKIMRKNWKIFFEILMCILRINSRFNPWFATRNCDIKTCNLHFSSNL